MVIGFGDEEAVKEGVEDYSHLGSWCGSMGREMPFTGGYVSQKYYTTGPTGDVSGVAVLQVWSTRDRPGPHTL